MTDELKNGERKLVGGEAAKQAVQCMVDAGVLTPHEINTKQFDSTGPKELRQGYVAIMGQGAGNQDLAQVFVSVDSIDRPSGVVSPAPMMLHSAPIPEGVSNQAAEACVPGRKSKPFYR